MIGLGVGMGVGLPLGQSVGHQFSGITQQNMATGLGPAPQANAQPAGSAPNSAMDPQRLQMLRELANLKASGILTDEEFEREKRKVLGS
jgi:hypothetical protein